MKLLEGKIASRQLVDQTAREVAELVAKGGRPPCIRAIILGNNPASEAYLDKLEKMAGKVGIRARISRYPESMTQDELLEQIEQVNADSTVDGLLLQLPLPKQIDQTRITEVISPKKDIDAFHPENLGRILLGNAIYYPATPLGIVELLAHYKIETVGKHVVVLGRSHIVGLPIANMLVQKAYPGNCTVTICHSATHDLEKILGCADIVIVAMGKPHFVKADMISEGAVVIDVGINRVEDPAHPGKTRLVGDVDFEQVAPKCSYITPVPGGVGPMTIIAVLRNTLRARQATLNA